MTCHVVMSCHVVWHPFVLASFLYIEQIFRSVRSRPYSERNIKHVDSLVHIQSYLFVYTLITYDMTYRAMP